MSVILLNCLKHILPFVAAAMLCGAANAQMRHPLDESDPSAVSDRIVFSSVYNHESLYVVVSKVKRTLYVYEKRCTGTKMVAAYPVCLGEREGNKTLIGDRCTPESVDGKPFKICEIVDASRWRHDFGDGRGNMKAYGHWFMRLSGNYPGNSIGIHGSSGNRYSVPGRGSEGCIRMRDEDVHHLKENYAFVGMEVYILCDK